MKNIILLFLFLVFFVHLTDAQVKTFNGPYTLSGDNTWFKGTATYTYTESEDYTRIKNGLFTFTINMSGKDFPNQPANAKYLHVIKGQYKNNLKNGIWTANLTITNLQKSSAAISVKSEYSNGIPVGNWTYKAIDLTTNKILESISISFVNGLAVGNFNVISVNEKENLSGFLDEKGYYHGKIAIVIDNEETINEYVHGMLKLTIVRNNQTGEVTERTSTNQDELAMVDSLRKVMVSNPAQLENIPYRIEENNNRDLVNFISTKFKSISFPDDIKGEYDWVAFKFVKLKAHETKQQKEQREREAAEAEAKRQREIAEAEAKRRREIAEANAERMRQEAEYQERRAKEEAENIARRKEEQDRFFAQEKARNELLEEIHSLEKLQRTKEDKIENLYVVEDVVQSALFGYSVQKIRKKEIYNSYKILLSFYKSSINSQSDLAKKITTMRILDEFYDKIINLSNEKTSILEKQLEKTDQPLELVKIFNDFISK